MSDVVAKLGEVAAMSGEDRVTALVALGASLNGQPLDAATRDRLRDAFVTAVQSGAGAARERLVLGELLSGLGDPRLRLPSDADYWVTVQTEDGPLRVGRHLVTNHEFAAFVAAGGYAKDAGWSPEGLAWRAAATETWPGLAARPENADYVLDNQPVVGVTYYEAEAYAASFGARLPRFDERLWVVRGPEKRPYPWGAPFGEGNANTREEVLDRPCAVGLYVNDCTPDGVYDLAGNVAEWTADDVGGEKLIHPGAWDQPSMASWAKAKEIIAPNRLAAGLGFRLVKDA